MEPRIPNIIQVTPDPAFTHRGTLSAGKNAYPCALGPNGISTKKQEGDGCTPAGSWPMREIWYRPDRLPFPKTNLPTHAITADDGWCVAPADPAYNQAVHLPYRATHENLWRDDGLYDLLIVIGYNDRPATPNLGSAIFLHIARPGFAATEGCVALRCDDLQAVAATCTPETMVEIIAI